MTVATVRKLTGTRLIAGALACLGLAACAQEDDGFSRDWESVSAADSAVPPELRQDYDLLLSCLGDKAIAEGQSVPEMSVDRVADIVDTLQNNPSAAATCQESLPA